MSNFYVLTRKGRGHIFFNKMPEKQKFHGIAVEKSNGVVYHITDTRQYSVGRGSAESY